MASTFLSAKTTHPIGGGGGGGAATAKLVMAYVMYGLLNGLITLTQADIDATSKAEPDPPEAMAPDEA